MAKTSSATYKDNVNIASVKRMRKAAFDPGILTDKYKTLMVRYNLSYLRIKEARKLAEERMRADPEQRGKLLAIKQDKIIKRFELVLRRAETNFPGILLRMECGHSIIDIASDIKHTRQHVNAIRQRWTKYKTLRPKHSPGFLIRLLTSQQSVAEHRGNKAVD